MKNATRPKIGIAAIGVDRGGTWTRVAAFDARLRPVKSSRFKTTPLRTLPGKLTPVVSRWPGGSLAPLVIASRGVFSKKWKKPFLVKALANRLNLTDVISDAEAAHFAAFRGKAGLLLVAGTGAVVFTGVQGAFKKTGGFNPPAGDPGSGRWLGRQYLKARGRLKSARSLDHGQMAAYAARLLARAEKGEKSCALLAAAAARELAELVRSAAGPGTGRVKIATAGGLTGNRYFMRLFAAAVRLALPGRKIFFIKAVMTAERAAASIALAGRKKP